jgi:uncharacterized membrane-anchored protein
MRFSSRSRTVDDRPGVTGTVRIDRRTSALIPRLRPGDVAVIDHLDLDRGNAEAFADAGVAAVVNASEFISGRYPNLGPDLLTRAGVVLVDGVGREVFAKLREGSSVRVHDGALLVGDEEVARGQELSAGDIASKMEQARAGVASQLQSFTHNTTEFLRREQDLLLHGEGIPALRTRVAGRPVVVVVRGYDYREDLKRLRRFIKEQAPVLVGVDSGADALLSAGHRPDVVVVGAEGLAQGSTAGERGDTVSDKALRSAREVVLHTDRAGRAVGSDRLERLAVRRTTLAASGSSADVALLMADASGASLLVTVGTHASLDQLLDRQREGLSSTFLTRLRVGPKLVDAKGVPQLYSGRVRLWQLVLVVLAGLIAVAVAVASTPVGKQWWSDAGPELSAALADVSSWIQGLFS